MKVGTELPGSASLPVGKQMGLRSRRNAHRREDGRVVVEIVPLFALLSTSKVLVHHSQTEGFGALNVETTLSERSL